MPGDLTQSLTNSSFSLFHPSSGVYTVNTVESHLKIVWQNSGIRYQQSLFQFQVRVPLFAFSQNLRFLANH